MQNGPYLALPCGLISAHGSDSKGFCSIPSGLRLLVGGRGEDLFLPDSKPGQLPIHEGLITEPFYPKIGVFSSTGTKFVEGISSL